MSDLPETPPPAPPSPQTARKTIPDARAQLALKTMSQMALQIEKSGAASSPPLLAPGSGTAPEPMGNDELLSILGTQINTLDMAYHFLLNRAHKQYDDVANFRVACRTQDQCLRTLRLLIQIMDKQKAAHPASSTAPPAHL